MARPKHFLKFSIARARDVGWVKRKKPIGVGSEELKISLYLLLADSYY